MTSVQLEPLSYLLVELGTDLFCFAHFPCQLVEAHQTGHFSLSGWANQPLNPKPWVLGDEKTLAWIVVVDTLNFCFWHHVPEEYFAVDFNGTNHRGYMSLCALINRAIQVRWKGGIHVLHNS